MGSKTPKRARGLSRFLGIDVSGESGVGLRKQIIGETKRFVGNKWGRVKRMKVG